MKRLQNNYSQSYLIYTRKSTDDSDNQKNSISYQKTEILRYAVHERLPIAPATIENFCKDGIISEHHTGFKEDDYFAINKDGSITLKIERPKFAQLVQYLHEKKFKGVIFLCWDRASRNDNDDNILKKLRKLGIDIRFAQATYDHSSAGDLHMDTDGMFAKHHSRVTSEKVKLATRKLRAEGFCTYKASIGYLNLGDATKKPFDPVRAPLIKRMFEKYDQENISLRDLEFWAKQQGLTSPPLRRSRTTSEMLSDEEVIIEPTERPLKANYIGLILRNPFYIGLIKGNDGTYIHSNSHEPLIDKDLFDRVQLKLSGRCCTKTNPQKAELPYRGLIRCDSCKRAYSPYKKKGIVYYRNTCINGCLTQRSFNQDYFETATDTILGEIYFSDAELEVINGHCGGKIVEFENRKNREITEIKRQRSKTMEDLNYLIDNKLPLLKTGAFTPEALVNQEKKLHEEIYSLDTQLEKLSQSLQEAAQDVVKLSQLLREGQFYYRSSKPEEKEHFLNTLFFELKILDKTLIYSLQNGFKGFEHHSVALGAPESWILELLPYQNEMKVSIERLSSLLNNTEVKSNEE